MNPYMDGGNVATYQREGPGCAVNLQPGHTFNSKFNQGQNIIILDNTFFKTEIIAIKTLCYNTKILRIIEPWNVIPIVLLFQETYTFITLYPWSNDICQM